MVIEMEKIKVFIKDENGLEQKKGKLDRDSEFVEIKKKVGFLTREKERYDIKCSHIIPLIKRRKRGKIGIEKVEVEYVIFVDRKSRKSFQIGKSELKEVDQKTRNKLDYLIDRNFWKALIGRVKISLFTALTLMFAGYGIIRFIEYFITIVMSR